MGFDNENDCEYAFYDFGTVSTGRRAIKTFEVSNYRTISQFYEVIRDPHTNPLDQSFNVKPYVSPDIDPGGSFIFEIEYAPVVPFTISFDYFNVSDTYGIYFKFGVKGKSLGPLVEISKRELLLSCVGLQINAEESLKLRNDSGHVAKFQFDVDELHYFQVHPRSGVMQPNSEIIAKIKFMPPRPGIFSRYLFCLIQYQSPLMINVVGIYTYTESVRLETVPLRRFHHQGAAVGGYESYVADSKNLVIHQPPVVLSNNCIDFGQTDVNGSQSLPQAICVTNNIKTGCIVEWEEDLFGIFLIEPARTRIAGDTSAIFEVFFRPSLPDNLYSRELTALVHWNEKTTHDSLTMLDVVNDITVPLTVTVRLMGHTFTNSSFPSPQYNLCSRNIRMPPCVPPLSVYNTFTIEKEGPHPLIFKFIPPAESRYVLKPMQGVIRDDFQIIVAGVCPDTKEENSYFERWTLQFNGSPQYEVFIDLCAYAEYPKIHINEDNTVVFPPTFPKTEQNGQVCLQNFTRHFIWYRFTVNDPVTDLWLVEDEGSIASNEITYVTWKFVPKHEGQQIINVTCDTCALLDCWCPFGTFVGTNISVYTKSEYTELVSFPNEFDCGVIGYGQTKLIQFHLFNFGNCKIYFTLKCISCSEIANFVKEDVKISPVSGKIEPFGKMQISVSISPLQFGGYVFAVAYGIVDNSKSSHNVLEERKTVTTIQYECVMSRIQISDINYVGGGPIISKVWLWRMLNINSLNTTLREICPGESPSVHLNVPHAVLGSKPLTIFMLIHNISQVKAEWNLKYIVSCNCVIRKDYISRRVFKHQCAHRDQVFIHPLSGELESNGEDVLMIKIKYIVPEQNNNYYRLEMGNNRSVIISFLVISLPQDTCSPSLYSTELPLQGIFIGDNFPCIQAYWLYNNACQPSLYYVDQNALRKYNIQHMYDVITCVNPSGTIAPQAAHPILFQFTPRALDSYEVNIPICLGTQYNYNLNVKGNGVMTYHKYLQPMTFKAPGSSKFDMEEISVFLSTDHFLMGSFLTHSLEECIIFVENRSQTTPMGYSWQKYILPDFLTCTVKPSQGTLQPGETQVCKVNIKSHFQPCLLTVPISCAFVNLNLCQKHEEVQILLRQIQQQKEDIFTITEEGFSKPECTIALPPLPIPLYRALAVSCNVTSSLQEDAQLSLGTQLRLFPTAEAVGRHRIASNETFTEVHLLDVMKHVIDTLIWDAMFNERFQNAVQNIKSEDSAFFGQFIMDQREERKLVTFQNHVIPRNILARTIRDIIFAVFLEEYNLE